MQQSSEKISSKYLEINNCNIQHLSGREYYMLRENGRVDYYILYIVEGMCYLFENGEKIAVPAGNIVLYRPSERQEYLFGGEEKTVSAFVHFSGTAAEAVLADAKLGGRVMALGGAAEPLRLFRAMVEEWGMKKPCYESAAVALFLQFLSAVGRQQVYLQNGISPARQHSMDKVLRHMHTHYIENHTVAFYAAMCHQSEGRFAHAFKESTGTSPKHYMLGVKMDAAAQLLATTTLSVAEIARAVGIEDENYVSRLFKRFTGKAPRTQR